MPPQWLGEEFLWKNWSASREQLERRIEIYGWNFFKGFSYPPPVACFDFDLQRFATCKIGDTEYDSFSAAVQAANTGETITMTTPEIISSEVSISKTITLDLNGQTLTCTGTSTPLKVTGETFTLQDTSEAGNGKITSASVTSGNILNVSGSGARFVMTGGTVENTNGQLAYSVRIDNSATAEISGGEIKGTYGALRLGVGVNVTVTGANTKITAESTDTTNSNGDSFGVVIGGKSTLTVGTVGDTNGPTITAKAVSTNTKAEAIAISGNGSVDDNWKDTTINIYSGNISGTGGRLNSLGIYHPQIGESKLNISGGTIEGGSDEIGGSGVEIRAGDVEVTGGTITGKGTSYSSVSNGSGSTTKGVGIALSQHTTKREISIKIRGDNTNISGLNAISAGNPQGNDRTKSGNVSATIDGGTFTSTKKDSGKSTEGNAILADSANVVITVNAGTLDGDVTVNKVEGAATDTEESTVVVAGGETKGKVQVVETTTTTTTDPETGDEVTTTTTTEQKGDNALKVMGAAKVTDVESAKDYVSTGYVINDDGKAEISSDTGWAGRKSPSTTYDFVLAGSPGQSLLTATGVSNQNLLKFDSATRLIGIPDVEYSLDSTDSVLATTEGLVSKGFYLAKHTTSGGAVTIQPETSLVRIIGTGFVDDAVTLTTANGTAESLATLGIVVDATDNSLANITGGLGRDSIKAGDRATTLDGGEGDDTLEGGDSADTFVYSAGNDTINNYNAEDDKVSLGTDLTPPGFDSVTYNGGDFTFTFDEGNTLTFKSAATVSLPDENDKAYTYQGHTGGGLDYIAQAGVGISLGSAYGENRFNGTTAANEEYATIDAGRVTNAIRIIGNDKANYIVAGAGNGTLEGGAGNDKLDGVFAGAAASLTLNGGDGDDTLIGGTGADYNLFIYTEGADSISGYHGKDLVSVRGSVADLENAEFDTTETDDIKLGFGTGDSLTFNAFDNGVSIQSGRNTYVYKKNSIARNDDAVTLTPYFEDSSFNAGTYNTVNAVSAPVVSIMGNDNDNVIFGSKNGGTLGGGEGKDKLILPEERTNDAKFVFEYSAGKDTIDGFVAGDKLDMGAEQIAKITKAKSSKSDTKLEFTFGNKSNVLTFKSEDEIGSVSLQSGGFLTKDGVVSIPGNNAVNSLKLFASARGKIDLTDTLYSISGGIASINASDVKKQSVTIVGASGNGTYTFAGKNKKKDQFEYSGGNVTINGYEAGVDKLELGTASLGSFTVDNSGVSLSAGSDTVVLANMNGQEVLLHHAGSTRNSFSKMVFAADGVILNKSKRPTAATVSGNYDVSSDSTASTVKKIFVADGVTEKSIKAGDKAKTTIDASAAGTGVTLVGGERNDKLIGSTSATDTFIYTAGKDIIENYSTGENISIGGSFGKDNLSNSLLNSKISAGKRSIKFKFNNKSALTIKPAKGASLSGALNIDGATGYSYSKNAIISASGTNASLTSKFSGSYKLKDKGITNVNGAGVEKNLTYKGTKEDEVLTGGTKKTTFKGGGGNDAFTGGTGKDVFFYAKGDKGDATIADFDFNKDKIKIASGTITSISSAGSGIKFNMNSGRKGSANIGSFQINNITNGYNADGDTVASSATTLIKANNNFYWFAEKAGEDVDGNSFKEGALITRDTKVSKSEIGDCAVIDLGYSTNLVKSGVAYKVASTGDKAVSLPK